MGRGRLSYGVGCKDSGRNGGGRQTDVRDFFQRRRDDCQRSRLNVALQCCCRNCVRRRRRGAGRQTFIRDYMVARGCVGPAADARGPLRPRMLKLGSLRQTTIEDFWKVCSDASAQHLGTATDTRPAAAPLNHCAEGAVVVTDGARAYRPDTAPTTFWNPHVLVSVLMERSRAAPDPCERLAQEELHELWKRRSHRDAETTKVFGGVAPVNSAHLPSLPAHAHMNPSVQW